MKPKKHLSAFLYALASIVLMAVILVVINQIVRPTTVRLDCTEDKLYTLSEGTEKILKGLKEPVSIRFYYSKDVPQMPVMLKNYATRVDDLLREYRQHAGKFLDIKKLNPKPDSDAEDSAHLDGVSGQSLDAFGEEQVYLGLAVSSGKNTKTIPFLNPRRESLLEYDLTRAIIAVSQTSKPKLGLLSPFKMLGGLTQQQMMMQMQGQQQRPQPAWIIADELKQTYDIQELQTNVTEIPADITALMLVHPKKLSDDTLFAIDQFVLRGGRLIAFVDPISVIDLQTQGPQMQQFQMPSASSNLEPLFKAWGVNYNENEIVVDRKGAFNTGRGSMPTALGLQKDLKSFADDVVTKQLSSMLLFNAGSFSGTPVKGIVKTPLLFSTEDVSTYPAMMALQSQPQALLQNFKPTGTPKELAIRLTGKFPTAFPNGKPVAKDDKKDATKDAPKTADKALKESVGESIVVLVADADCLHDAFSVQKQQFANQVLVQPFNQNLSFALNLVEHMTGDEALFKIRSRAGTARPFTVIKDMEIEANKRYQAQIEQLEKELMEMRQKIVALQRDRKQDDRELLSADQKKELQNFRKREAEIKKNLKGVRKELREDVEALENKMTVINIALMPLVVVLCGIIIAIAKSARRKRA